DPPGFDHLRFGVRAEAFRRELSSARHHRPRPAGIPRQDAQGTVRGVHLLSGWCGRLPPRPLRHGGEGAQSMGLEALATPSILSDTYFLDALAHASIIVTKSRSDLLFNVACGDPAQAETGFAEI